MGGRERHGQRRDLRGSFGDGQTRKQETDGHRRLSVWRRRMTKPLIVLESDMYEL